MLKYLALLFVLLCGQAWGQGINNPLTNGIQLSGACPSSATPPLTTLAGTLCLDNTTNPATLRLWTTTLGVPIGTLSSAGAWVPATSATTIIPPANSLVPALVTIQSGAGTATGGIPGAAYAYNLINISSDAVNSGAGATIGLDVSMFTGGSGTTGNRAAIEGAISITQVPTTAGDYIGVWGFAQAGVNFGGTLGAPSGSIYGTNPQVVLVGGATFLASAVGEEVDATVLAGASVANKFGINVTTTGNDAVAGYDRDYAIAIGSTPGSPSWGCAICLTNFNGNGVPLSTTGTILGIDIPITGNYGIDLRNLTCTNACYASNDLEDFGGGLLRLTGKSGASTFFTFVPSSGQTASLLWETPATSPTFELATNSNNTQFYLYDHLANGIALSLQSGTLTLGEGGTSSVAVNNGLNQTTNPTLAASGVTEQNLSIMNVNVPTTALQGVQILQDWQCNITGAGTVTGAGHVPCIQSEAYSAVSSNPLLIPIESVLGTLSGAGTLTNGYNFLAKVNNTTGATISTYYGLTNLSSNSGTVTFAAIVDCAPWSGTAPTQSFCLYNSDSSQVIYTAGQLQAGGRFFAFGSNTPTGSANIFETAGLVSGVPTMSASSGANYITAADGAIMAGNGTVCDASLANDAGAISVCVPHGTQGLALNGTLGLSPATWTDTQACTAGQISVDASFIYACTASNTVKRATLATF